MSEQTRPSPKPLEGIVVVALEQAVAAPYCSSRLADAGARVIKIERPEGDFARGYDRAVFGEASYFVWINRGKESIALDLKRADELQTLLAIIEQADVFIQNLAPGAAERLGLGAASLRERFPRLVTCDISGYGTSGPGAGLKAYDLLVQAESGLVAVNGAPGEWGRIGVSLCDIGAGMNAVIGILQALMVRDRTGRGSGIEVSLFGTAAELMAVPYLQARYGGRAPARVGLRHPSVAPYGAFGCADAREIVISVQNEREWASLCEHVMGDPALARDPRFCDNTRRCENRQALDETIAARFAKLSHAQATAALDAANVAYGSINSVEDLIRHPQLRTRPMAVHGEVVQMPAIPYGTDWDSPQFAPIPTIDEHGEAIRRQFAKPGSGHGKG
jgi:itaconate CoA-transferase